MRTVLLTGATGFLGSHLLERLVDNGGYEIILLKRSSSNTWRISHVLEKCKSYDLDKIPLSDVFSENTVDVIIHLATLYRKFDNDGSDIKQMIESNILFPSELLELGIRGGVKGFINTGTFFEYDCSLLPVNEQAKNKPFNFYAKTKLAFESLLSTYADKMNIVTLRLFSPYGEKDNNKLIPMIVKKAVANERIELSDGLQKLDFVYAGDIVDAYMQALIKIKDSHESYSVFNIGSGVGVSVREVVSIVEQKLGKTINKVWGEPSVTDIPVVISDISHAEIELKWYPKTTIQEGIGKVIQYYEQENVS